MDRQHNIFRIVLGFVILFGLMMPSIAFAASGNSNDTEVVDKYTTHVNHPGISILAVTQLSEASKTEQVVDDKNTQAFFFSVVAGIAVLATGIIAGTVFAYANSVMPGLRHADNRTFVLSMRYLTSSVANPIFLIFSNGALIAQIGFVALAVSLQQFDKIVLGSVVLIFYIATLLITFLGNLPLNKAIISAEVPVDDSEWNELRVHFEARWTRLNQLRTFTCMLSLLILIVALLI